MGIAIEPVCRLSLLWVCQLLLLWILASEREQKARREISDILYPMKSTACIGFSKTSSLGVWRFSGRC